MNSKKLALFSLILAIAEEALAGAGGAHHGDGGIPWSLIIPQTVNVVGLFALLTWAAGKAIRGHFAERQRIYLDLVQKADAARSEAERSRADIAMKLSQLEASSKQSISQAQAEAKELEGRLIAEAKEIAAKAKLEAERTVQQEIERAKNELRIEMLTAATEAARAALKEKVGGPEQKRLQSEFADKIQVVR